MQSEAELEKIEQKIKDGEITYEYSEFRNIKTVEGRYGEVYEADVINHSNGIDVVALKKSKGLEKSRHEFVKEVWLIPFMLCYIKKKI